MMFVRNERARDAIQTHVIANVMNKCRDHGGDWETLIWLSEKLDCHFTWDIEWKNEVLYDVREE